MNTAKTPHAERRARRPAAKKRKLSRAARIVRAALALALAVFLSAAIRGGVSAQGTELEGQHVVEVRVVDEAGNPAREQTPALALKVGDEFHFSTERASLRTLYGTGDYANIRVTAVQQGAGLRVDFIVTRDFYNNVVRIYGLKEPPTEPAAQAALRLTLGEPFREGSLKEGIARLEIALADEGLFQAKVTYDLEPHADTRQMDVNVHVDPGVRARIGAIMVKNQTRYSDAELLHRAKITNTKKTTELTSARLTRSRDKLRTFLVNQGYLGASALITAGTLDSASNTVPLTVDVTAGPKINVVVNGAKLGKSARKKLLPIYAEGAVDEDLLQEGRRNIRDYFQREGYFNADVEVKSQQDAAKNEQSIEYDITRGDRYKLVAISFDGNHYFGRKLLADRLQLQTASFAAYGRYSQQLMRADADAIKNLYLTNGFLQADVTPNVSDTTGGKKNNLTVKFHIVEGQQTRISELHIVGNEAVHTDDLVAVIGSTEGQPFSEAGVASDRNNILAYYYNDGFPQATFVEQILTNDGPNKIGLIYHITEGPRIEVAQVLLTGYQFTRPGIIARQVEVHSNGPLREGDVVDSERRLYNLGIFNRVQIAPQNPDGTDPVKTVVTDVREGNRYTVGYGGGFEVQRIAGGPSNPNGTTLGASPRGIFEIARNNMFGRAQTLSFTGRASTLEYRATGNYSASNFLTDRNLTLQFTAYADKAQDVDTFTSTRFQGGMDLVDKVSTSSSFVYQYFYRRVKASDISQTINPEQIPLYSQPTLVSGFGVTYARDRRDNPADASRGNFNTVDASDAFKALGSSADFFRFSFQNSTFYPFGREFVFARSMRFGFEEPLGSTVEPDDPSCTPSVSGTVSCETIPLPERFFAGGGASLRGFSLNQAGPRDPVTGFPIGGLALLTFNQELRFPMKLPFVGNRLGGTVFYDGGNVYSDVDQITLRWKSPSVTDLNYFSNTVGFGVRYPTPVGPVRVDIGYQLNPAQYQAQVTSSAGVTTTDIFRLPHFGFFFNIGSIF
jgi:outer membrane protein assembly complex protein YaeT